MDSVYKFLLFAAFFSLMTIAGYRIYRIIHKKIKAAGTSKAVLGWAVLLFLLNAALLAGGLFVLIKTYALLAL